MKDTDIEDFLETHGQYSADMASKYHISKHSASSYLQDFIQVQNPSGLVLM